MKRIVMMAFLLTQCLVLGACSHDAQPSASSTAQTSSIAATPSVHPNAEPAAPQTASTPANPSVAEAVASAEQVTETETPETADTAAAQPLALRINQLKPEPASEWKEGTHYTRLVPAQPTSAAPGQVEVTEVFWYGCPHCYALDATLENWRKTAKPNYVSFVRVPVMWGPIHHTHARIFYTAELLGKLDELHTQIFQEIHQRHNPLDNQQSIEAFFTSHGVAQADFQKDFSSFAVESSLKKAEAIGERYKITSVPTFIINGKYVTDVAKAGSPQQLLSLINELASRERGT